MTDCFSCLDVTKSHRDYNKDSHVHKRPRHWNKILLPQSFQGSLTLRDKRTKGTMWSHVEEGNLCVDRLPDFPP